MAGLGPRILFVLDSIGAGGAERSTLELAARMQSFQPLVCALGHPKGASLTAPDSVEVVNLGTKGIWDAARSLRDLVRWHRPTLVHSTLFVADMASRLVCRDCHVPLISSLVGDNYALARLDSMGSTRRLKHRIIQSLDAATVGLVDGWHAISSAVADQNASELHIDRSKIRVIPRGRDRKDFQTADRAVARLALGLTDERCILQVGRLVDGKGHEETLEAIALIQDVRLLIAGDGPLRAELMRRCHELGIAGRVFFLGHRRDVPQLLAAADVFVFPSRHEGLGGSLIEAMWAGVPIVASDIPVFREVLEGGRHGQLVSSGDPGALAAGILSALGGGEEWQARVSAARSAAESRFDLDQVVVRHEEHYRDVIEGYS